MNRKGWEFDYLEEVVHGDWRPVTVFEMARVFVRNAPFESVGIQAHRARSHAYPRVLALNELVELPNMNR